VNDPVGGVDGPEGDCIRTVVCIPEAGSVLASRSVVRSDARTPSDDQLENANHFAEFLRIVQPSWHDGAKPAHLHIKARTDVGPDHGLTFVGQLRRRAREHGLRCEREIFGGDQESSAGQGAKDCAWRAGVR